MTNPGSILHAERNGTHCLRLVGAIRYPLAPSFDRFLQHLFAKSTPSTFLVDLSETEMIDSTNLGLLIKIARLMSGHKAPPVVLFSPREDITEILVSMGFGNFFHVVTTAAPEMTEPMACEPIAEIETDPSRLTKIILEAHRALMEMDRRNEAIFLDVVRYLEKES